MPHPSVPVLQFLGAAGTVTGSRFLVETPRARVLVDCGLFQGEKALRLRNWEPFPVPPASLDAVVLTHAHVDHSGYLPALGRDGFRGAVFATRRTLELCRIVLPDSGRLQEEDAAYANRKGFSKHDPALSLFTEHDAEAILEQLPGRRLRRADRGGAGRARELPAGRAHPRLGERRARDRRRRAPHARRERRSRASRAPAAACRPRRPPACDVLLVEATYGDRTHDDEAGLERFAEALRAHGGAGRGRRDPRLRRRSHRGRALPAAAPDARRAGCRAFRSTWTARWRSPRSRSTARRSPAAIPRSAAELHGADDPFDPGDLREARDVASSKAIHGERGPAIIVSASGMATGGRVLHHLAARLPDPRNSVILTGFQASETRGRLLLEGRPLVKMLGRYVPVRAEVVDASAFSVHADQAELRRLARARAAAAGDDVRGARRAAARRGAARGARGPAAARGRGRRATPRGCASSETLARREVRIPGPAMAR